MKKIKAFLQRTLAPAATQENYEQWPEKYSFNAKVSYYFETGMEGAYLRMLLVDESDIKKVEDFLSEKLFYGVGLDVQPHSQYVILDHNRKEVWSNIVDAKKRLPYRQREDDGLKVVGYLPSFRR